MRFLAPRAACCYIRGIGPNWGRFVGPLLIGVGVLLVLAGAEATAGDLSPRLPAKAPAESHSNWSGFYGGLNAGWGWSIANARATPDPNTLDFGARALSAKADGGLQVVPLGKASP